MTSPTEKMLTTSWNLVREAGTAVTDAAVNSDVGAKLARNLPKLKEVVSVGAGLALARKGTKVAANAVRRNPVAAIAGAVALAGVGLAVAVVRNRKKALEGGKAAKPAAAARAKPKTLAAKNMRGNGQSAVAKAKPVRKAPAKRKP
jgi:hypothetical protein